MADAEKTTRPFVQGDPVCNVNPASLHHGKSGTFIALLPWKFWSKDDEQGNPVLEPACDVQYAGECGPYGYPYIAQRVSDLVLVTESEVK